MQMLLMTAEQADDLRAIDSGIHAIDPRLVGAGEYAGLYAVPARLASDPRYALFADALASLQAENLDPAAAWPVEE